MTESRSRSSSLLEPPPPGVETEDPGAQKTASDSDSDQFCDAPEHRRSSSRSGSRTSSPVPRTRVERVDSDPAYGEVPGSTAYQRRASDAVPDEIEIAGRNNLTGGDDEPQSSTSESDTSPVPRTVIEKVDPSEASYGEEPGTAAYESRVADAAPDSILKAGSGLTDRDNPSEETIQPAPESPIPETLVSRVESFPSQGSSAPPKTRRRSPSDAQPDAVEIVPDVPGSSTQSTNRTETAQGVSGSLDETQGGADSSVLHPDEEDDQFGDDFDAFEEGGSGGQEDDFGDFDDTFQEPSSPVFMDHASQDHQSIPPEQDKTRPIPPPLLNFDSIDSLSDLLTATAEHLDTLFPNSSDLSSLPQVDPIPNSSSIFITERSLSLWSQLVAPPPLQPPNWTKSRIRRLFLISLGVPVDLDEILPASKQKKLILPSIQLEGNNKSNTTAADDDTARSSSRPKKDAQGRSSRSIDSTRSSSRARGSRQRGRKGRGPPALDLSAVHRLCSTTDAALSGFTDEEMRAHVAKLEDMKVRASEVLEFWVQKKDGQVGDKEAFEGVIENLVRHARQVRK